VFHRSPDGRSCLPDRRRILWLARIAAVRRELDHFDSRVRKTIIEHYASCTALTKNRISILQTLLNAEKPLSLNEIHHRASTKACAPDFATVFRVLTLLEKLHIAQKVNLNQSCSHYELLNPTSHFDHVVCTECGKVIVIVNSCPVRNAEQQIERQYGFSDLRHSLEFFGKCRDCN
jgi:Fur family ferric uptake transcriptional regulator